MSSKNNIEVEGKVIEVLKGGKFKVLLENGLEVTCTLGGKLRMNYIRVIKEDRVTVSLSPYDLSNGIIVFRNKS